MNGKLKATVISSTGLFLVLWTLGKWGPHFIANDRCYAILGCNAGFFGYDALLHFVSGIMITSLIIFFSIKFSAANFFHDGFWKNMIVVVSLIAMIAVFWEIAELGHDQFRMKVLHENLRVPTNRLDQPSNDDTMGDITFAILGGTITGVVFRSYMRKK